MSATKRFEHNEKFLRLLLKARGTEGGIGTTSKGLLTVTLSSDTGGEGTDPDDGFTVGQGEGRTFAVALDRAVRDFAAELTYPDEISREAYWILVQLGLTRAGGSSVG